MRGLQREQLQKRQYKNMLYGGFTLLLVLIILFCTSQTVMGHEKTDVINEKRYYAAMEKQYLADMKQILEKKGYADSGITLRWVSEENGMRSYTVMLHHRKIEHLSVEEKNVLQQELAELEFEKENCQFVYDFMVKS